MKSVNTAEYLTWKLFGNILAGMLVLSIFLLGIALVRWSYSLAF
jgi:F0F1-type ATP synthase membrane subunit a